MAKSLKSMLAESGITEIFTKNKFQQAVESGGANIFTFHTLEFIFHKSNFNKDLIYATKTPPIYSATFCRNGSEISGAGFVLFLSYRILQSLSGFKHRNFPGGDADFFTGLGIASFPGSAFADFEAAETD